MRLLKHQELMPVTVNLHSFTQYCSAHLGILFYVYIASKIKGRIINQSLTLSAHLGGLFVFVTSFLVTSLLPTKYLKQMTIMLFTA